MRAPESMPHDLPKAYDPTAIEDHWAEYWVREQIFTQPALQDAQAVQMQAFLDRLQDEYKSPFTILLPPPNVTGRLHMGHMLNQTEMDILTRWQRMRGERSALWVPGTDHAGIATQMMVERQLAEQGLSRQELGRDAFLDRVWAWKKLYGGAILDQMKRLGASVDWSREYFTMDDNLSVAVREAFVRLHEQGLIYRGAYIVNWCPRCQTAISDLEVVHEEQNGKLWEIRYPVAGHASQFLTIATTRPETLLGDVAVAIHPEDERFLHLHGKKLLLPLVGREIPIVLDDWVSRDFGTGAVKVTPAHDPNDFALGQRHHLPSINVMDDQGRINAEGGAYTGLDRYVARKRILADLETQGLLATVRDHKLSAGVCDRCKTVVEPRLSEQWFLRIQPLAEKAIQAVELGTIRFTPEQYKKTYLNWMTNIHDWCLSRQLWWGHRIPAWHCADCNKMTVARQDPTACAHCGSSRIKQETDVLDTWFSSGLLPVSVFGWPFADGKPSADFATFYPTSLLVTGFDILFFWVARMIMLGCWFTQDIPLPDGLPRRFEDTVPFREVYIHALVRDAHGDKMSKTKGNVVDPIETVRQYGTDAVRFTLASMASPGTDIAFNIARTEGYRAFANKIWNAARFIFMNVDRAAEVGIVVDLNQAGGMPVVSVEAPIEARWIVAELHRTTSAVNLSLENYRFDEAANFIYQFFWGQFCDWYLEIVKLRLNFTESQNLPAASAALNTLVIVFEAALRLLSPFMPFLTEEIWHAIYNGNPPWKSIALAKYPLAQTGAIENAAIEAMESLQSLITEVRALRKEIGVEEKAQTPVLIRTDVHLQKVFSENQPMIERLARVSEIRFESLLSEDLTTRSTANFDVAVVYQRTVDVAAESERLNKEIARLEKGLLSAEKQLGNSSFLSKAPVAVVDGLKKQQTETTLLLAKAQQALAALGKS
uniref:valine--tRNA ligase n=1 Tax=mine drainage metagenome TaxID=410659 RepID=E6PYR1_9ZZZZ